MRGGDPKALREELHEVEADLAELRHAASELRHEAGGRRLEPGDGSDRAFMIMAAAEQEAYAVRMEARRDELRRRLEPPG